ncbi:tautomerase family protein [Mycobacterium sp. M1]|uniref:Tautomerase family protein n=1 Tax=Mycolicibacter acidiphilus TaxID=2835306 RepID=A0ABS5RDA2_9MYCO|nr:tautomerase family protein [Mycolicibacter acidiphilus]MBS9532256.1 tautomerase family protein [Mycolicibacter acidiphilus]
MPSTVVEIRRSYPQAEEVAIIDAVHDALVAAFGVPAADKRVRLLVHEPHRFACPESLARPELATIVTVDAVTGRPIETKRHFYREVVERLAVCGIPADHVTILLREGGPDNWGVRGGQAMCDVDPRFAGKY